MKCYSPRRHGDTEKSKAFKLQSGSGYDMQELVKNLEILDLTLPCCLRGE